MCHFVRRNWHKISDRVAYNNILDPITFSHASSIILCYRLSIIILCAVIVSVELRKRTTCLLIDCESLFCLFFSELFSMRFNCLYFSCSLFPLILSLPKFFTVFSPLSLTHPCASQVCFGRICLSLSDRRLPFPSLLFMCIFSSSVLIVDFKCSLW